MKILNCQITLVNIVTMGDRALNILKKLKVRLIARVTMTAMISLEMKWYGVSAMCTNVMAMDPKI